MTTTSEAVVLTAEIPFVCQWTYADVVGRYEEDMNTLRGVFGGDAEMMMRGISVASTELSTPEALQVVLETKDAKRLGREMTPLQARIARAMWPDHSDDLESIQEGPLARLARDMNTLKGRFPAGTPVRVLDRFADGRLLVGPFDRDGTVFPIAESDLSSFGPEASP